MADCTQIRKGYLGEGILPGGWKYGSKRERLIYGITQKPGGPTDHYPLPSDADCVVQCHGDGLTEDLKHGLKDMFKAPEPHCLLIKQRIEPIRINRIVSLRRGEMDRTLWTNPYINDKNSPSVGVRRNVRPD